MVSSFSRMVLLSSVLAGALSATVPLGRVWERVDQRSTELVNGSFTARDEVYAVGSQGAIWRSTDLENWVVETTLINDDLFGITRGNGTVVAVGASGRILSKSAGGPWSVQPSGSNSPLRHVVYGGSLFVAVGDGGVVLRSTDGRSWTAWSSGVFDDLRKIMWDGSKFFAVGGRNTLITATVDGDWQKQTLTGLPNWELDTIVKGGSGYNIEGVLRSEDGETWSNSLSTSFDLIDCAFGAGVYVGCGPLGLMTVSQTGNYWQSRKTGTGDAFVSIDWDGEQFVAITKTRKIFRSPDGYRWTGLEINAVIRDACWGFQRWVIIDSGRRIFTSLDGRNWTAQESPTYGALNSVAYGAGRFVAVGSRFNIIYSEDGKSWFDVPIVGHGSLNAVHWTGSEFLAVGDAGSMFSSADGVNWEIINPGNLDAVLWDGNRYLGFSGRDIFTSENGNDWTLLSFITLPLNRITDAIRINDAIWTGELYIAVGRAGYIFSSPDGVTWTHRRDLLDSENTRDLLSVTYSGSGFVAVGNRMIMRSSNGTDWRSVSSTFTRYLPDVANNGSIFVTVGNSEVRSSTDGYTWETDYLWPAGTTLKSIVWTGGEWVVCGSALDNEGEQRAFLSRSSDLAIWNTEYGEVGEVYERLVNSGGEILAIGTSGKASVFSGGGLTEEDYDLSGSPRSLLATDQGIQVFSDTAMVSWRSTAGEWSSGDQRVSNRDLIGVTSGAGKILVAGGDGASLVSEDGENWMGQALPESFVDVLWTGDGFKAISQNRVYSSATGDEWTEQELPEFSTVRASSIVSYDGNIFVGGTRSYLWGPTVWEEVDGEFVVRYSEAESGSFFSFEEGAGQFLVSTTHGTRFSADGREWRDLNNEDQSSEPLYEVIPIAGGFVAGGKGRILHSPDGEVWTTVWNDPGNEFRVLREAGGLIVAAGSDIVTSPNGVDWSKTDDPWWALELFEVIWNGVRFVAFGPGYSVVSSDGVRWEIIGNEAPVNSVAWDGTRFLGASPGGDLFSSVDGTEWSMIGFSGDLQTVISRGGTSMLMSPRNGPVTSSDQMNWIVPSTVGGGARPGGGSGELKFLNEIYHYVGTNSPTYFSADGVEWSQALNIVAPIAALVWTGDEYIANFPNGLVLSFLAGQPFSVVETEGAPALVRNSVWTGAQIVAVGDGGTIHTSPDGAVWEAVESGTIEDLVKVLWTGSRILALSSNGALVDPGGDWALPEGFVARDFMMSGSSLIVAGEGGLIAVFESEAWSVIDTGAGVHLNAIARTDAGFMVVGDSGTVAISNTTQVGGAWTVVTQSAMEGRLAEALSFSDGVFKMILSDGSTITSVDGLIWMASDDVQVPGANASVGVGNDMIAVGDGGTVTRITPGFSLVPERNREVEDLFAVANSGDRLVAVGAEGIILISKTGEEIPDGFDRWMAEQGAIYSGFLPEEDWDRDGLSNVMEYLHGFSSSRTNAFNNAARLPFYTSSGENGSLSFEILTDDHNFKLEIWKSGDFQRWDLLAEKIGAGNWFGVSPVNESDGTEGRRIVTVGLDSEDETKAFYQLVVIPR